MGVCRTVEEPHRKLHESAIRINELLAESKRIEAFEYYDSHTAHLADQTCEAIDDIIAWNVKVVHGLQAAQHIYAQKTQPSLEQVQKHLGSIRETVTENVMTDEQMLASATQTRFGVLATSIVAGVIAILLALTITAGIRELLTRITAALEEGAAQVSSAANQVSSSSQSLAEGSAEQAASIEETSSSLKELSSMTRRNADNAGEANTLAAKNTADLITQAMMKADSGVLISREVAEVLKEIDEGSTRVNELIGQITTASREQAEGVDQINTAVSQMDQVIQTNAASSEETAAAAEELSAQAEEFDYNVAELQRMIRGYAHDRAGRSRGAPRVAWSQSAQHPAAQHPAAPHPAAPHSATQAQNVSMRPKKKSDAPLRREKGDADQSAVAAASTKTDQAIEADKLIPFDDHEEIAASF